MMMEQHGAAVDKKVLKQVHNTKPQQKIKIVVSLLCMV